MPPGYQAFVHFVGADGDILFTDDHVPFARRLGAGCGPIATRGRCSFLPASSRALGSACGPVRAGRRGRPRLALRGIDRGLQIQVGTLRVRAPDARHRIIPRREMVGPEPPGDTARRRALDGPRGGGITAIGSGTCW